MPDAPKEVLLEIAREYENSLTIPSIKPHPQWMLMPVGISGSGKSTVIKPLAARFNLIRLCTDEVRQRLHERGYSFEGCRDITHDLSKKYLELGYSLAIDANTGGVAGLEYNKKTAVAFPHVRQIFIYVYAPEEVILERLRKRDHSWLYRTEAEAIEGYYKIKKNFTKPDLPFVYEFDTSLDNLSEQIDEAVKVITTMLQTGVIEPTL